MSLGTYGSTLLSELNRLANGGTYPPVNTLDEASAARAWAALSGVTLTVSDTVGVLNEIANLPREDWLDYSGVCNYIAGTTGLPAAAALRQVTGAPAKPVVQGGGDIADDGTYFYRTFRESDSFTVSEGNLPADILIVGGGGAGSGGGWYYGGRAGGGGGGDYQYIPGQILTPGTYVSIIGAGGAGGYISGNYSYVTGGPGGTTEFGSSVGIIGSATGGGAGRNNYAYPDANGGNSGPRTGGLSVQSPKNYTGGSGASSASNGLDAIWAYWAPVAQGGADGTTDFASWLTPTGVGENSAFSGGGGAGPVYSSPSGPSYMTTPGGLGGGRFGLFRYNGSSPDPNSPANTGGGAGGKTDYPGTYVGSGGSGFVIVRYLKSEVA